VIKYQADQILFKLTFAF